MQKRLIKSKSESDLNINQYIGRNKNLDKILKSTFLKNKENLMQIMNSKEIEYIRSLDLNQEPTSLIKNISILRKRKDYIDNSIKVRNSRLGKREISDLIEGDITGLKMMNKIKEANEKRINNDKEKQENAKKYEIFHFEEEKEKVLSNKKKEYESLKIEKNLCLNRLKNITEGIEENKMELNILRTGRLIRKLDDIKEELYNLSINIDKKKDPILNEEHYSGKEILNRIIYYKKIIKNKIEVELKEKEIKIKHIKTEIQLITNELFLHYLQLLYEGHDVRQDGLIWIIKAIWKLGKDVPLNYFPSFLDCQSIDFLFNLAQKTNELNEVRNELKIIKENIAKNPIDDDKKDNKILKNKKNLKVCIDDDVTFRTSLLPKLKPQLKKNNTVLNLFGFQHNIDKEFSQNIIKLVKEIKNQKCSNYDRKKTFEEEKFNEINNKINSIDEEIQYMKDKEIERITNEFLLNDYQNKYSVIINVVVSALFGEKQRDIELVGINQKRRKLLEKKKLYKFYNPYFNVNNNITQLDESKVVE